MTGAEMGHAMLLTSRRRCISRHIIRFDYINLASAIASLAKTSPGAERPRRRRASPPLHALGKERPAFLDDNDRPADVAWLAL